MKELKLKAPKGYKFKEVRDGEAVFEKVDEDVYDPTWRTEENHDYWVIDNSGDVIIDIDVCHYVDNHQFRIGNYYKTQKQAEKALEKQKAIMRVKRYCWEKFGHFEPDWGNRDQDKWVPMWDGEDKEFSSIFHSIFKYPMNIDYLNCKENSDQLIKDCEDDLKVIFNIQHD